MDFVLELVPLVVDDDGVLSHHAKGTSGSPLLQNPR